MARQNPVLEVDRQIGARLRLFRLEWLGMTAAEFSRRIGIDSNRLATYEHGRVPIRFELAMKACREFNISQRWLYEGIEPKSWFVSVPRHVLDQIPNRMPFSTAYQSFLKPAVEGYFSELVSMYDGKLEPELLEVLREVGRGGLRDLSAEEVLKFLHQQIFLALEGMPFDLYNEFGGSIWKKMHEFKQAHAKRIEEWKNMPRAKISLSWKAAAEKTSLTNQADTLTNQSVKPVLPQLIQRLKRATESHGKKSELAKWLGVHRQMITDWLSERQEPGGENTLRLLHWVEQQERQK